MKRGERAKSAIKLPSRSSRKDPMEKVEAAAGVAQRALADLIAVGRVPAGKSGDNGARNDK